MEDDTLIFVTGQDIVGIYSVKRAEYIPYQGAEIRKGIERLVRAKEIVTYNGNHRDLIDISKFMGLPEGQLVAIEGHHTDMREICWSTRIWGSSLVNTYEMHFNDVPHFADTYEGSNEQDVYMTFKLWECLKNRSLKVLDGNPLP